MKISILLFGILSSLMNPAAFAQDGSEMVMDAKEYNNRNHISGTGIKADNEKLAAKVAPLLWQAMAPGGVVVSGDALAGPDWAPGPHPESVAPERYFVYRKP